MIGARQDGRYGSRTAKAVKEYREAKMHVKMKF